MKNTTRIALPLLALLSGCAGQQPAPVASPPAPIEVKEAPLPTLTTENKSPSAHTGVIFTKAKAELPFSDKRDFQEQAKGFIAAPTYKKIMADAGHVAWDMEKFQFLLEADDFDSIHPSLTRQSKLNMNYGLYEVMPGIYQVRGFDLANITFIKGKTGWIVFDPLTAAETSRAAKELIDKHIGKFPIKAVIYSHSHGDHWGGVRGLVDEKDVIAGKVQILAPRDFMQYAVSENVFAGTAMARRMFYQYGVLLPAGPRSYVGQGLGQGVAAGSLGLIPPTRIVEKDYETITIDGIKMEFQNTPNTEAPSEMNTYFPDKNALWMGENFNAALHNIYTLRGAMVRDALAWSKYLNIALFRYGKNADVLFASHHWPRWGNERVQEVLRGHRDLYANMNNQILHLANQGVTINEVHNVYKTPKAISDQWYNRGYHGSPEHNSRAVINRYLGYWDANPSTLIPLSPGDSAPLYVEMMGGADKIIRKGKELHDAGKYREAQEILTKLLYAEPDNETGRLLLADVWEQIGYQQENPGLRNSFLNGAYEVRHGIAQGASPKGTGPDVIRAMSTELFLDYLGIQLDQEKATGQHFVINLITPDNKEKFVLELSNSTLTNIMGEQDPNADFTLTINRTDLEQTMMGKVKLADQIASGKAKIKGDPSVLQKLGSMMTDFENGFEILPGTKGRYPGEKINAFEVDGVDVHAE